MGIVATDYGLHDLTTNATKELYMNKHAGLRAVVGTVCCLSMIGSIFVALSYLCFKDLRSQARQILLNLSLMDFCVGLANFSGIVINFDKLYMNTTTGAHLHPSPAIRGLCIGQAFIAFFCTYGSVFWTISLAIYMYLLIFQNKTNLIFGRVFLGLCYLLNYGMAAGLCIWFLYMDRFGHSIYGSTGWCSVILVNHNKYIIDYVAIIVGYDLWIYLTVILCTTIYVSIFIHLNIKFCLLKDVVTMKQYWSNALHFLDYKLIFIPAAFILLRVWTCILSFLFVYLHVLPRKLPTWLAAVLILLSGIGDSGQGAANGLLFVLFTSRVRNAFLNPVKKCYRRLVKGKASDDETASLAPRPKTSGGELTPSTSLNYGHSQSGEI